MSAGSARALQELRDDRIRPRAGATDGQLRLLMASGGDERLGLDPATRRNRYGVPAGPAADELWLSSSTACAVSARGWTHASEALARLVTPQAAARTSIGAFFDALRERLLALYGAPGAEAVLSASGTEAEFLALLTAAALGGGPVANIVVGPGETGSGVPAAAAGRHFLPRASLGGPVACGARLAGLAEAGVTLETIEIRCHGGRLREAADVDTDAVEAVDRAVAAGRFALLHVLDASKTGRTAVSRAAARGIAARHPERALVVVDACQLRCAASDIRADLEAGLAVMVTGSKFAGGPPFCGALLIPAAVAGRLRAAPPAAEALGQYTAALDWPAALRPATPHPANLGLGLRWTAALAEIEAYEAIPAGRRAELLAAFDAAARWRIAAADGLAVLDADQGAGAPGLIAVAHTDGADARKVYAALADPADPAFPRVHLGQPVMVGWRAALRVCASMPMISFAAQHGVGALEADLDLAFEAWSAARIRA